jgi:hypothetical protein
LDAFGGTYELRGKGKAQRGVKSAAA